MKKLYFHPERKKLNDMPVFINSYYHEAITYFLRVAEVLEPQFIEDLDLMTSLYTKTEKIHEKQVDSSYKFIDGWDIFEQIDSNSHLIELKNAVIAWIQKYNLVKESDSENDKLFLEIALWAIPDKRDHPQRVDDLKERFKKMGKKMPIHFYNWSITDVIYYEDESEVTGYEFQPDRVFPFVFTPGYFTPSYRLKVSDIEPEAHDYENILINYDKDVKFALKGDKDNVRGYTFGEGWDPRIETWSEFEETLDDAFKKYKQLYKERTQLLMEEHGYTEGKHKRNKEHFEWLVRYQLQEWSINEIADYYSTKNTILVEDTIRKALTSTAKLIGLRLR